MSTVAIRPVIGVVLMLLCVGPGPVRAQESVHHLSTKALDECDLGRRAKERDLRLAHFEKGQALAERAVAMNEQHADAHFALFCSLGEQLRIDGENLSSLFGFRRVMRELDRTLELNPDHLDALSSKGTLLVRLPVLMGGDAQKGEQMLRRVVRLDPKAVNARLSLARVYAAQGQREQAMSLAKAALEIAQAEQRADLIPEVQMTLSGLRSTYSTYNERLAATP